MAQERKGCLNGGTKSMIRGEEGVCGMREGTSGVQNGGGARAPQEDFC